MKMKMTVIAAETFVALVIFKKPENRKMHSVKADHKSRKTTKTPTNRLSGAKRFLNECCGGEFADWV